MQANQPTTDGPTTQANQPTTEGPTTQANQPTTDGPTTQANQPTTEGPTTQANQPTTDGPTTQANQPTTEGPTTQANQPTTDGPTTQANQPTTEGPTTQANQPTTDGPTTQANQPTTDLEGPTTQGPMSATTMQSSTPGLRSVTIVLSIVGVNNTALNSSDYTDPNSAASMELAELVARVIASVLGENATTSDVESVSGAISFGPDGVVFTGDVFVPVDSPVTPETIMEVLSNQAAAAPLTDGQSTLDVDPAVTAMDEDNCDPNPCMNGGSCADGINSYVCTCVEGFTGNDCETGLRSVTIVLNVRGVNGTALISSDFTDPNSAASMELAELVARVIASVLGENATTSDVESVSGAISIGPDGVVFTGDVFVPVDSPVTADTIMEVLSNQAAPGPLTDGQSTLDVDPAVTAMDEDNCDPNPCMNGGSCTDGVNSYVCTCAEGFTGSDCEIGLRSVTIVLNVRGVNGTALVSSDFADPNSAASMELAELVARVIASVLGENATTSDVESVIGGISVGPDGVVFTGDVFVPVDSPVTAETIMEVLSNQAVAAPLTDGQSTLDVDPAVTAMDEDNCDPNPCMNGGSCVDGVNSYVCTCVEGFTGSDCEIGLRSVTIVLNVRGVNGTALVSSDFTDPNSAASMELAELVARVIASVLGENATTSDVESVIGGISVGPDVVVFTGDVFVPVDSPVTAETIMEVLSNQAAAAPLTDGQSTLDVDPAVTAMDEDNCDPNPCMNGGSCTDGVNSYVCTCVEGFTGNDCEIGLRSVTIVLNVRGVNGTALVSSDFTDPNSAASMELAELVARVIASVLGENATTSDVESVIGGIFIGPDGVVFTGDVFVPVDSPVTAETIMEVLSNQAAAAPLTDGQSTLDVDPAVTAMDEDNCDPNPCMNGGSCTDGVNSYVCTCAEGFTGNDCEIGLRSVTIVLNVREVNGTVLISSDFTDPNSAASMELAELVARVIASVLGENATTSDVESVIGGISVGPDGVVFTGDVFVPVDSPVTAETIMEVLSNQAAAAPLTDGQSTLNVDPAVTAMDEDNCDPNPCMNGGSCTDGVNSYVCTCVEGFTGNDCEIGLRSVTIVLNVRGVNGTALVFSDFTDPNSAASMELAELVARVIASVLGENATTSDVESVSGAISIGPDGVVFTGDVFVPVDSPVTAETIMEVLSNQAAAGPLTDGQSTLDVDPAVTAMDEDNCDPNPCMNGGSCADGVNSYVCTCVEGFTGSDCEIGLRSVTIVLNVRGVNGTALISSDFTDPNSAASMELAELVARVIASVLGENATTSDVESVIGGISVGPDGVVFTGDVFVPVDSPVTAETIMEVLSNQAAAAPLTDGQSTLNVDPAVTAMDEDNCDPNPCMNGGSCTDGVNSYVCTCVEGFTGNDCEIGLRSVTIVLNVRGVNGTALVFSDFTDPNSAASMELAELVARVIASVLGENATTSDVESVSGAISIGPDGVVFTGDVFVPVDSPVTAETIMEVLSNQAAAGPLTDGQSTLDVDPAVTAMDEDNCDPNPCMNGGSCADGVNSYVCTCVEGFTGSDCEIGLRSVTIVLNVRGVNGTALISSDFTDPNSAASMELAELVARVIASVLGENATTSDVESVIGGISVGPDGVVFTGDVFVPVDSPVTAETIMEVLSNQAAAAPLTDGQSTLDVDPAVTAMDEDNCDPNPCMNGGSCTDGVNSYVCTCAEGFTGSDCEIGLRSVTIVLNVRGVNGTALVSSDFTDPNSAASMELAELVARVIASVLGENATTSDVESVIGGISVGPDGVVFTGDVLVPVDSPVTAETIMEVLSNQAAAAPLTDGQSILDVDPAVTARDNCDPNPCMNGGSCEDGTNSYVCTCVEGFTGNDCEIDIDDCDPDPCMNGGACQNGVNSYTCTCVEGFTGSDCETDIDDCNPNPCLSGETCEDGINRFTCTCIQRNCQTDPCVLNPGRCAATPGQYCLPVPFSELPARHRCACRELDGYFWDSSANRCSQNGFRAVMIEMNVEGINGTALGLDDINTPGLLAVVAKVIQSELGLMPATSDINQVHPVQLVVRDGRVMFMGVVQVPAESTITARVIESMLSTLASSRALTDGQTTLNVDPQVTAMVSTTACPPNFCQNGGTCDVSGNYPALDYTCRCATAFTGSNCESVIPVPTEKPVTFAPTMAPGDSMSLLTAVLILLAVIALLLVLSCLCCFLALRLRRRRRRYPVYERRVMYAYFNPVAGRTMKRPEFVTPYVASGQEARNYYDQRAFEGRYPVAGRVVKNPILAEA
ncbi:protein eyes shut homolog isoform X2 [Patiria miniata]|uniref:EGF-like domain-containing protein n=1 Tax=Patiria miniata TaxID=46514 RepID=A0A913ZJ35_PATMI|nr:protein eyes shut homolog isoform X2 [Patiria miniata]